MLFPLPLISSPKLCHDIDVATRTSDPNTLFTHELRVTQRWVLLAHLLCATQLRLSLCPYSKPLEEHTGWNMSYVAITSY